MKRLWLITPILLVISITAIGDHHPPNREEFDAALEKIDELEQENEQLQNDLADANNRIAQLERDQEAEDERDGAEAKLDAVETVVKAPTDPIGLLFDAIKVSGLLHSCSKCGDRSQPIQHDPNHHSRTCKANHPYWICQDGSLHDLCCPGTEVWTSEYGCVEPGYSPPSNGGYSDDYDASGGSSSSSSSEDCTGEGCD